jgi:hypothetical protein
MVVNLVIQYVIKNYKNYISKKMKIDRSIKKISFSEKRVKMKKDQDPIERLAFHLITYRDVALNVANNGLMSDQLTFSIDKYLGKFIR